MPLALDGAPEIGHRVQLQLLRILQEAVSNSLRHAGAKNLAVTARWLTDERSVAIEVIDDGVGLETSQAAALVEGRGLRNMARRALSIGAELTMEGARPGTRVRVLWRAP